MQTLNALIVKDPYLSYILGGTKTWEMRSTSTKQRGLIALIKKGTGKVWGLAELVDVQGPFGRDDLVRGVEKHRIPIGEIISGAVDNWNYAWVLKDVVTLPEPVPYEHPSGAVIWVKLNEQVSDKVLSSVQGSRVQRVVPIELAARSDEKTVIQVPYAGDSTFFGPDTKNTKGVYRVGNKGDEKSFSDFNEALAYLKNMPVAKWRRPNVAGNWGIVSAVKWGGVPCDSSGMAEAVVDIRTNNCLISNTWNPGQGSRSKRAGYARSRSRKGMGIVEWVAWVGLLIIAIEWFL